MKRLVGVCLTLVVLLGGVGCKSDTDLFDEGQAAYDRGDFTGARDIWKPLAEKGEIKAQFKLGLLHQRGEGVPKDIMAAKKWFELAAKQGAANAQFTLGKIYDNGDGVPQDYKAAMTWYRLAADQGNVGAQYWMGLMYQRGNGVPKDYKAALKWYRLAAERIDAILRNAASHEVLGTHMKMRLRKDLLSREIAEAQRLVTECAEKIGKKEKGCESGY